MRRDKKLIIDVVRSAHQFGPGYPPRNPLTRELSTTRALTNARLARIGAASTSGESGRSALIAKLVSELLG